MSSEACLLKIPLELRHKIYAVIAKSIQNKPCTFEGNPGSAYDGLRLACRQLHDETQASLFTFGFTAYQLNRVFDLRANRTNFEGLRSVALEIPLESVPQVYQRTKAFLICMQLSLQELRIFFVGKDKHGNRTSFDGCGKKRALHSANDIPLLMDQGQDFEQQWDLLRHLAVLRNLRVLQIENANLPLIASMVLNNKPDLKALSITSDPRSVPSSLSRMSRSTVMRLFRNIAVKTNIFPKVEVISLCANSLSNIEGAINRVSPSLRHFSWRIPNPSLQPYSQQECLYAVTGRLMHSLSWRAPELDTLRLCASMREDQMNEAKWREIRRFEEELGYRLPSFPALKNLEIHYRGGDGYLRHDLIERLPPTLSRLYISDDLVSVTELIVQIRKRYFTYADAGEDSFGAGTMPSTPARARGYPFNKFYNATPVDCDNDSDNGYLGQVEVAESRISCGELRNRNDDIPLSGGALGFVNFEYSCSKTDGVRASDPDAESATIKIIRLNGQLLDREHNFHLTDTQSPTAPYGIKCTQKEESEWRPSKYPDETSTGTRYTSSIYAGLYDMEELRPSAHVVEKIKQDIALCLEKTGAYWEWYFGNEQEAMSVFDKEPVAKLEDQKLKPELVEVEVPECSRCRWACPEFGLPPVSSFPVPVLPVDWRDHIN